MLRLLYKYQLFNIVGGEEEQIPSTCSAGQLQFCAVASNIYSTIIGVFTLQIKSVSVNMHQQEAQNYSKVHRSLLNCRSTV